MNQNRIITIYSSNTPIECHILKGRLESDGIECFIYDDHLVWVHPFYAVAVGGVKLKVPIGKIELAQKILYAIKDEKLIDKEGEYDIKPAFESEILRQNEILEIKSIIRKNPALLEKKENIYILSKSDLISKKELEIIIQEEKEFLKFSQLKRKFSWKQFWYELLDFDRDFFKYLRLRPIEYYFEKELVENYIIETELNSEGYCPYCNSDNISYGHAVDYKWDIPYLILSALLLTILFIPFYPFRNKYHCFNCHSDFKKAIFKKKIVEL